MSRPPLLILRPEPGATLTAKLALGLRWRPIVAPIFKVEQLAWEAPPAADYDAVIVTSANAVRYGGRALHHYRDMPAYAVGNATARALKAADFTDIRTGKGNVDMLLEAAQDNGAKRALHLAGEDFREGDARGIELDRRILYRSAPIEAFSPAALGALRGGDTVVLLHSGRAAEHFAALCDASSVARDRIALVTLSQAIADSAGAGWYVAAVAEKPDDAALLAAADRICQ